VFSRITGVPILLAAAVAVPYLASNGPEGVKNWWHSTSATVRESLESGTPPAPGRVADTPPQGPGTEIYPLTTPLEGAPSVALEEVLRFDVNKEWVYQRWARKSTALSELGLYGVRVPLVTGTQLHDLAGSLTYFFDQAGRVQRIGFAGKTGDTTRIVMLAAQQFGLQPQPTPIAGEQLLQIKRGADVFSELSTRPASVLWSSSPHDSFDVELNLQRPDATTPLPPRVLPLPEIKKPDPTATAEGKGTQDAAGKSAEEAKPAPKSFYEKYEAYFPRSRVPGGQVENLEKRDRIW
jgi:hypothetical protein